ncbi:BTAD domain-containing putative transcriptional regulator [Fodinicola acaciae]|uniref:BTAD domain-containing putative transcriptional regulator n=1 Tax=Fodinicola acaciae TaxID=2681555 RepID=UPI001C9E1DD2|nr:BTAD domain-containing putative transcriptional regulator [Fodinicola acaciae]
MAGEPLIRFEILGPLRAWHGDQELVLGPAKQRAVLAALLVNANKPVSTSQIVDAVWDDEPPHNGANVVQKYVAGLRRVLEPGRAPRSPGQLLTRTPAGYLLRVAPGSLDADVFTGLAGGPAETGQLTAAARLWQGEPLAGLTGPLFDGARHRLAEVRAGVLEKLAELELAAGRHRTAVPDLVRLVADYPLRERPRELLMLALSRSGRQPEALAAYRDYHAHLAAELGIEPGVRVQELHQRILRAEPETPDEPEVGPNADPPVARPVLTATDRDADLPDSARWGAKLLAIAVPVMSFGLATWAVVGALAAWRFTRGRGGLPANLAAAAGYLVLACAIVPGLAMFTGNQLLAWVAGDLTVIQIGGAVHAALLVDAPPRDAQSAVSTAIRIAAFVAPLATLGFGNWVVPLYYAVRRRSRALWLTAAGLMAVSANTLVALALSDTDVWPAWSVVSQVVLSAVVATAGAVFDPAGHRRPDTR